MLAKYLIFLIFAVVQVAMEQMMMWPDGDGNYVLVDLEAKEPEVFNTKTGIAVAKNILSNPAKLTIEETIILNLYTKNNPTDPQFITRSSVPSFFNPNNPLRFIIHGYLSSAKNMDTFRVAYLDYDVDVNIILVDWSKRAYALYTSSKKYTLTVGKYVAEIILMLVSKYNVSMNSIIVIGHSLGAHIAGIVGYHTNGTLGCLVGMDAAGPLYAGEPHQNRIDASDAILVQALHTSAVLGMYKKYAHCDFYINGGKYQPACGFDPYGGCSHGMSRTYYIESINSTKFVGHKRLSIIDILKWIFFMQRKHRMPAIMGEHITIKCKGNYYLKTNKKPPYARG